MTTGNESGIETAATPAGQGEIQAEPVPSLIETEEDRRQLQAEKGRLLTQQLLWNLRKKNELSLQDVADRRQVTRSAVKNLESQDIATIKVGTLVKQLQALGYTDFTETTLVKLILDLIEAPDRKTMALDVDTSPSAPRSGAGKPPRLRRRGGITRS